MSRYSVQPRDRTFEKGYGFLYFAKYMSKSIRKNKSKSLSDKYSQKTLDHAKTSVTKAIKTSSKKVIKKKQNQLAIWLVIKLLKEL